MNMTYSMVKVNPNAIRFSQDSIAGYMTSPWGENVPLEENLENLKSGLLNPRDFPPLEVYRDEDEVLWSEDNRRLWLFRKAGISEITVKLSSKPLFRAPPRRIADRARMSSSDFFPTIREQSEKTADDNQGSLTGEVVKVNRNAERISQNSVPFFWSQNRYQDLEPKSDLFSGMRGQSQETASTSTLLTEYSSQSWVSGAVVAASALVMGFAGWNMYKQSRE